MGDIVRSRAVTGRNAPGVGPAGYPNGVASRVRWSRAIRATGKRDKPEVGFWGEGERVAWCVRARKEAAIKKRLQMAGERRGEGLFSAEFPPLRENVRERCVCSTKPLSTAVCARLV